MRVLFSHERPEVTDPNSVIVSVGRDTVQEHVCSTQNPSKAGIMRTFYYQDEKRSAAFSVGLSRLCSECRARCPGNCDLLAAVVYVEIQTSNAKPALDQILSVSLQSFRKP